jgi:hypothetical protein
MKHNKPNRLTNCKLIESGVMPSLHSTINLGATLDGEFKQDKFDKFCDYLMIDGRGKLAVNELAYGHRFDASPFLMPKDVWENYGPWNLTLDSRGITGDTAFFDKCRESGVEIVKSLDAISYHYGAAETVRNQKKGVYT